MDEQPGPFRFHSELHLVALTGLRATTLQELTDLTRQVPGSSIFYHTHHEFLAHHFERPTFRNDFALWAEQALQEDELSEKLSAVDLLEYSSVNDLREALLKQMASYIDKYKLKRERHCPPGEEFHFCRTKSFVLPIGVVADNPAAFFEVLPHVSTSSIFYHFVEARLRLSEPANDFTIWFRAHGEDGLAQSIGELNPYVVTLDELKTSMLQLGEKRFGGAHNGAA